MALGGIFREYPNQPALILERAEDVRAPRARSPVFYGCYDWHSAVHAHWTLARLSQHPSPVAEAAQTALTRSLSNEAGLEQEQAYLERFRAFERPYGLAWLLALHQELHEVNSPHAAPLRALAQVAKDNLGRWLGRLSGPMRTGTHNQTAFSMSLMLDWARVHDETFAALVAERAVDYFAADVDLPVHLEPGGEDFLSPSLGEADLLRRVMTPAAFATWFARALPRGVPLEPAAVTDKSDGRLAHLDGLNLSRAWMLRGAAEHHPNEMVSAKLSRQAEAHLEFALSAIDGAHYAGSHWLGTFAVYALT